MGVNWLKGRTVRLLIFAAVFILTFGKISINAHAGEVCASGTFGNANPEDDEKEYIGGFNVTFTASKGAGIYQLDYKYTFKSGAGKGESQLISEQYDLKANESKTVKLGEGHQFVYGTYTVTYIGALNSTVTVYSESGGTFSDGSTSKTYSGAYGSTITLPSVKANSGYTFVEWTIASGDGTVSGSTYTFGLANTVVKARYSAGLTLRKIKTSSNTLNLTMSQPDDIKKSFRLYWSFDDSLWNTAYPSEDSGDYYDLDEYITGDKTISITHDGYYTIHLQSSTGGNATETRSAAGDEKITKSNNKTNGASYTGTIYLSAGTKMIIESQAGATATEYTPCHHVKITGGDGGTGMSITIEVDGTKTTILAAAGGHGQSISADGMSGVGGGGPGSSAGGAGGGSNVSPTNIAETATWTAIPTKLSNTTDSAYVTIYYADYMTSKDIVKNVQEYDNAAPDKILAVSIDSDVVDKMKLYWTAPKDNGTTNYFKACSYQYMTLLKESNVVRDDYISGIAGYQYIIDRNSSTDVNYVRNNKSSASTTSNTYLSVEHASYTRYLHIAAYDKAGNYYTDTYNIGDTLTFEIPAIIMIDYDGNNEQINRYGDPVSTTYTGSTPSHYIVYDGLGVIKDNGFSKRGYKFLYWNTKADGTGTTFYPKDVVSYDTMYNLRSDPNSYHVTLYAQWEPIRYNIAYDNNQGTTHTGTTKDYDSSYRMKTMTDIRFDQPVRLFANEYIRKYYITLLNAEPWKTELKSSNGTKNSASGWLFYSFAGWKQGSATGTYPYYEVSSTTGLFSDEQDVINLTDVDKSTVTLYASWKSNKFTLPSTVAGKNGYTFLNWSHKECVDERVYNHNIADNKDDVNYTVNKGTGYKPYQDITLYAHWYKDIKLTLNLNGGAFNGVEDDIISKGTYYDYEEGYTFGIFNNPQTISKGYYDAQIGNLDIYGTYDSNGVNSKYLRIDDKGIANGTLTYRLLGWSHKQDDKTPELQFDVYDSNRAIEHFISDSETLYAVWEPILQVNLTMDRTLGTLQFKDGSTPQTTIKNVTAITANPQVTTIIKPGEQGYYSIISSNSNLHAYVGFDTRITNIYTNTGIWTDSLNPSTPEDLEKNQGHGLNRMFIPSSTAETRKFYIPQYLGTSQSYEGNAGVAKYTSYFKVTMPSYYYNKLHTLGKVDSPLETVYITGNIYITSNITPYIGPINPDPDPDPSSILGELKTTIN